MNMKRTIGVGVAFLGFATLVIGLDQEGWEQKAAAHARPAVAGEVPVFQVDPSWPKIPNNWVLGQVPSVSVDAQDHVWILQRPGSLKPEDTSRAAPPVLEFDAAGNFLRGWGGPGEGYEWPESEHGLYVDHKGYIWIGGNTTVDNHVLKFTQDGKFVLQIGRKGQSRGNKDTKNLNQPTDTFVYPKTNELFVADGYGNRRVIVFDADSGAFKRMWGAFGNAPADPAPSPAGQNPAPETSLLAHDREGPGPQYFSTVHAARVSNDGLVYVSDRGNKRVQVFTIDGTFVTQVFIDRYCQAPECGNGHTAASTAFSTDSQQRFLYVGSRSPGRIMVLDRKTLEILDSFGRPGAAPGEFNVLHHMDVDSNGNLYVTEVQQGRRIQKFVFKGLSTN